MRKIIGELLGRFIVVLLGRGRGVFMSLSGDKRVGRVGVGIGFGVRIIGGGYGIGDMCGGDLKGGVCLGMFLEKGLWLIKLLMYRIWESMGGIFGRFLIWCI
ncbi:aquaporin [Staphylococcus saprophyticus]|uniref:aquaporin n=1 Tax=Staphylococcus saprophyticus TaxID=29385 RepID=UPI00177EB66C|nr:aquaporin [Staphylococcus saprophyticus]